MTAPLSLSYYSPDDSGPPLRPDITVGQELRNAAADAPHADALVEGLPGGSGRRWTYAELLGDAEQCAQMLLDYFEPGERFGMWAHNLPEWVIMEYGAALAGLTLVTLNPSLQSKEAAYVLRQSKSSGVFVVPEVRGNPIAGYAAEIQAELPDLRHILRLDELHDLISATTADRELPHVSGSDPAQIQYTSGTTGFPKGVVLRHHSVVDNARIWTQRIGISTGASWVSPMPLFHTGGCVLG
ncbi:MAG: AMP-binding protein, partial [Acidimicrobiaceae bacterium]|nr:AMP-binding protein [Acidimicrobiaceae bacterium]